MLGEVEQAGMSRRDFMGYAAKGAAFLALSGVFPSPVLAQEQNRELITPREFLERLEAAGDDADVFYDVQRRYEIYGEGADFPAVIGIQDEDGSIFREITINFNLDNLARIPAAADRGYPLTAQPTHSFLKVLHEELYRINPNDPRPPRDADSLNFEWRSRASAEQEGANIPETWDELGQHFIERHGVVKDDLLEAIRGAVTEIRGLDLNGRRASLDIHSDNSVDFG